MAAVLGAMNKFKTQADELVDAQKKMVDKLDKLGATSAMAHQEETAQVFDATSKLLRSGTLKLDHELSMEQALVRDHLEHL